MEERHQGHQSFALDVEKMLLKSLEYYKIDPLYDLSLEEPYLFTETELDYKEPKMLLLFMKNNKFSIVFVLIFFFFAL